MAILNVPLCLIYQKARSGEFAFYPLFKRDSEWDCNKRGTNRNLLARGTNPCLLGILGADMMSCVGVSFEKCSRASQHFRNCFSTAWELRNRRRHAFLFEWRKHMPSVSHCESDALRWGFFFFTQSKVYITSFAAGGQVLREAFFFFFCFTVNPASEKQCHSSFSGRIEVSDMLIHPKMKPSNPQWWHSEPWRLHHPRDSVCLAACWSVLTEMSQ